MWKKFKNKMSQLVDWKSLVTQWKNKFLEMTFLLDNLVYRVKKNVPVQELQTVEVKSNNSPISGVHKRSASKNTSSKDIQEEPLSVDPLLSSISWNEESIIKNWFIILKILDNPNKIMESENFAISMNCIQEIIEHLQNSEIINFGTENG